jgi:hypothetical protein
MPQTKTHKITKKDYNLLVQTGFSIYICGLNSEKDEKLHDSTRRPY